MNPLLSEQQKRNLASRAEWDRFAGHRARVMELLANRPGDGRGSICILGAGNCNDVDLRHLATTYDKIHLVDCDSVALHWAVQQQPVSGNAEVFVHGNVDLAGMVGSELPGPFDTVASLCLLSQMIESLCLAVPEDHPAFLQMLQALRQRHLRLLIELTRPGGRAVLVTDVVSSATAPGLPDVSDKSLPDALRRLIADRNFFTGLNPFVLLNLYASDAAIAPQVTDVLLQAPWLWNFGPRVYAVCAITATRSLCYPSGSRPVAGRDGEGAQ